MLLLLLLCAALFLAISPTCGAQIENSPNSLTDWKSRYLELAKKIGSLERAWKEHKVSLQKAREKVSELQASLETLQISLEASQQEVTTSTEYSQTLQQRLDAISEQVTATEQVAQAAIRKAYWTGGMIGAAGVLIGIIIAVLF